ncbi:hypothetical protein ASPACDRAFT_41424 [Aspergillus aculeatus ATCC 16872]|uniref:Myb-like domain-containing protein n=1 Tax=Aspergillus aculeatus (strain ATCC 16872 / CBS 172.66 / WB 5094) TaxID=690307 RepID=A0A1L9WYB9_ASPA1|nr:uncharacterized protein ASPACDRAFT_41424 [Aspergillus aculeatus ATCC 16872]OJK01164.1 hypothetical protein ASPACDRAFT_41424 [Aspergillus aculeatus ATCC 16872]
MARITNNSKRASPKARSTKRPRNKAKRLAWSESSELNLMLTIAYVKKIKLTEEEWKEVGDRIGGSWNAARQRYGTRMSHKFPDWKRGSRADKELLTSSANSHGSVDAGAQSGEADTTMHDHDDNNEWDDCTSEGGDIEPGIPEEQTRADLAETGVGRVC